MVIHTTTHSASKSAHLEIVIPLALGGLLLLFLIGASCCLIRASRRYKQLLSSSSRSDTLFLTTLISKMDSADSSSSSSSSSPSSSSSTPPSSKSDPNELIDLPSYTPFHPTSSSPTVILTDFPLPSSLPSLHLYTQSDQLTSDVQAPNPEYEDNTHPLITPSEEEDDETEEEEEEEEEDSVYQVVVTTSQLPHLTALLDMASNALLTTSHRDTPS